MKLLICISIFLNILFYNNQKNMIDINFIIMIDDELVVGTIAKPFFKIEMSDGNEEKIEFFYEPGLLRLNKSDFEKINSDKVNSVTMVFGNYPEGEITKGTVEYEIDFDRSWLTERYTILKVFNLNKKKYKKIFFPLENRNYTFEAYTPNPMTSIIRIRKD